MSATTLLAAGELASWGAVSMAITGSADWDTALFAELKAGTLTEAQAKALWTYTDGYQVRITATTATQFNPANLAPQLANSLASDPTPTLTGAALALARVTETEYNLGCAGHRSQLWASKNPATTATVLETTRMIGMTNAFLARPGTARSVAANYVPRQATAWPPQYCPPQEQPSRTQAEVDADGLPPTPCQRCRQTFCITKLTAGNSSANYDDRKANAGRAADGYYCFEMDRARMDFMQYWKTAALAGASGVASGQKAQWEVAYVKGRAVDRKISSAESAAERDPASPHNNQAAIFGGTSGGTAFAGNTASITQALTATGGATVGSQWLGGTSGLAGVTASPASLAAGKGKLDVRWYQPKWQKNDYYQNNFRINYADTVRVRYCNPTYDWAGTGGTSGFLALVGTIKLGEAPTGGGFRWGAYDGQLAAVHNIYGTALAAAAGTGGGATFKMTYDVPYPAATGMLAEVVPKGTRPLASTCYWKNSDVAVVAPKNGAAALFASVSAIAFGAAVLAI